MLADSSSITHAVIREQKNLRLYQKQQPFDDQNLHHARSKAGPPAEYKQNCHREEVRPPLVYGATTLFKQLNGPKSLSGASQSPISDSISSLDGSQPDTPPSVTSGPPFQFEDLKQQVERLQSELHKYRQREAQDRITQHTMNEIVGPASDTDHLLISSADSRPMNSGAKPFQFSAAPSRQFPQQSDSWALGLNGNVTSGKDTSKPSGWTTQPAVFGAICNVNSTSSNTSPAYPGALTFPQSPPDAPEYPSNPRADPTGANSTHPSSSHDSEGMSVSSINSGAYQVWPSAPAYCATPVTQPPTEAINNATVSGAAYLPVNPQMIYASNRGPFLTSMGNSVTAHPPTGTINAVGNFGFGAPAVWNNRPTSVPGHADGYSTHPEPLNYRRLLEKDAYCNWDYVVDKIVSNNDQQASIFLQQKLKIGSGSQKYEIVEAILKQCYPLMINRFGNFLVQRCFEHGTMQQIDNIAHNIRTHTVALSMDPFGCHVVQKALDCVSEDFKSCFVHELLRRIPDTVIHRYACHVWQKLFELHWSNSPPNIMKHVNESLKGMWHEVALGETGSLVVQNIFENCVEEDKRPCIDEVLANIDVIARGQFGNWCIQHICENGLPGDKGRAVDHVICYATEYSIDQYASKVIEKCLKVGGTDFFDRYLTRVCEARPDRPRMPLIDIAGDQFGNYLIQYILANASPHHRELVATHVRKHMVSLRGSKYGSRVAMLCSNPSTVTRPGPPSGSYPSRYSGRGYRANHYA